MLDAITSRRAHAGARETILPSAALLDGPIIGAGPLSPAYLAAVYAAVPSAIVGDDVTATVRPPRPRRVELEPTAWEVLRAHLTGQEVAR